MKVRSLKQQIRDNRYYQFLKQHREKTKEECEDQLMYARLNDGWVNQMRFKWIDKQYRDYIPYFKHSKELFQVGVMEFNLYVYIGIERDYLRARVDDQNLVAYININPQFSTKESHPYRKPLPDDLELEPEAIQDYAREVLKEYFYLEGRLNRIQHRRGSLKKHVIIGFRSELKEFRKESFLPYDAYATSRVLLNKYNLYSDDIMLTVEAAREGIKREKETEVRRADWSYPTGFDGGIDELHDEVMGMNRNTQTLIHI